ncbi:hypothetical protein LINPERHAP2_LOCUS4509 [Linum perenne]
METLRLLPSIHGRSLGFSWVAYYGLTGLGTTYRHTSSHSLVTHMLQPRSVGVVPF